MTEKFIMHFRLFVLNDVGKLFNIYLLRFSYISTCRVAAAPEKPEKIGNLKTAPEKLQKNLKF